MEEEKELTVWIDDQRCAVDVSSTNTLCDVRAKILEDFDHDMLPEQSQDFSISIGTTRLSKKQESRKLAWDVIAKDGSLTLHAKTTSLKRPAVESKKVDQHAKKKKIRYHDEANLSTDEYTPTDSEDEVELSSPPVDSLEISLKTDPTTSLSEHTNYDQALQQSGDTLKGLSFMLQDPENGGLVSETRRKKLLEEIDAALQQSSAPDTTIGVLGATGVGKSSVLNALLDEGSILPTSGSRGCTAAVVELRFNRDLLDPSDQISVYKGRVEFITLQEWHEELKILLDECCTHDAPTVFKRNPDERANPEAAASWAKINQVYGAGTMEKQKGKSKEEAWDHLSQDSRVSKLLTCTNGNSNNTILVNEGTADALQAKLLLEPLSYLKGKLRSSKKKWAKAFRAKINNYVYRQGTGDGPQTWPLIRKVVLFGPWQVLSTGACLVDLPGVRDSNVARARVAENYLQHCHYIWIMATIKRAVDDGTAKELLGEQFKRRLLMDGQYCNVRFICTQSDDCESSEVMRDHIDVAKSVEGRWEKMNELKGMISELEKGSPDTSKLEDLQMGIKKAKEEAAELKEKLEEFVGNSDDDDEEEEEGHDSLEKLLKEKFQAIKDKRSQVRALKKENEVETQKLLEKSLSLEKRLKAMSAIVRNEYSTKCLQDDFLAGLDEMTGIADEKNEADDPTLGRDNNIPLPLPDGFQFDVNCVSSNDYMKIRKVKERLDGPPNTFANAEDTQIPALRDAVHITTSQYRRVFAQNFVVKTNNLLDQVKLHFSDEPDNLKSAKKFREAFEKEMGNLDTKIVPIANDFVRKAETRIGTILQPPMLSGAKKSVSAAAKTVISWGSSNRRTKQFRGPNTNGLHFSTYNAALKRYGVYTSKTAGSIDFNMELYDPMEREISAAWQNTMDGAMKVYLKCSEDSVRKLLSSVSEGLKREFGQIGMDASRLDMLAKAANNTCASAIKTAFNDMKEDAQRSQRSLNRSLLPQVSQSMYSGYCSSFGVTRGPGTFQRMKDALEKHAADKSQEMFDKAADHGIRAVFGLVKRLSSTIKTVGKTIRASCESVYAISWEQQQLDPAMREQLHTRRIKVLKELESLWTSHNDTMKLISNDHEEMPRGHFEGEEKQICSSVPMDDTERNENEGELFAAAVGPNSAVPDESLPGPTMHHGGQKSHSFNLAQVDAKKSLLRDVALDEPVHVLPDEARSRPAPLKEEWHPSRHL